MYMKKKPLKRVIICVTNKINTFGLEIPGIGIWCKYIYSVSSKNCRLENIKIYCLCVFGTDVLYIHPNPLRKYTVVFK